MRSEEPYRSVARGYCVSCLRPRSAYGYPCRSLAIASIQLCSDGSLRGEVVPRGFQIDREATANHKFLDRRSFISKPKLLHQENIGHYILYGKDKSNAHDLVMYLSDGICAICKKPCTWEGEWDHIGNRGGERCDCVGNGRWVHGFLSKDKCHQVRHHQAKPHKEKH